MTLVGSSKGVKWGLPLPWWAWAWAPLVFPTVVAAVGAVDVAADSDGSVNIGVTFVTGGDDSSVSNQLVGIQGELAGAWIYSGQILATDGSGGLSGQQATGQQSQPQMVSAQPGTFRFRFGGEGGGRHGFVRGASQCRSASE